MFAIWILITIGDKIQLDAFHNIPQTTTGIDQLLQDTTIKNCSSGGKRSKVAAIYY